MPPTFRVTEQRLEEIHNQIVRHICKCGEEMTGPFKETLSWYKKHKCKKKKNSGIV